MRPLLILDCDGVILEFFEPFRLYAEKRHRIGIDSALIGREGWLFHIDGGAPVDRARFDPLLNDFFRHGQLTQNPLPGVADALGVLERQFDIEILTNVPHAYYDERVEALARHGFGWPVHCNEGAKGPKALSLCAGRPVTVFVDDLPGNHASIAERAADIHRLHMVGEPDMRPHIHTAKHAHQRIDDWPEACDWILSKLEETY